MCSAPLWTGGVTKEKYGYQGTKVSGKTINSAPFPAASSIAAITRSSVATPDVRSGAICTAAARTFCFFDIAFSLGLWGPPAEASERPGVEDEGVVAAMQEHEVEHIERVDRPDALDHRRLAVAV